MLEPRSSATKDDIRATLDGLFARWQMPDEIRIVDLIARTSVGKVDKRAIRAELARSMGGAADLTAAAGSED